MWGNQSKPGQMLNKRTDQQNPLCTVLIKNQSCSGFCSDICQKSFRFRKFRPVRVCLLYLLFFNFFAIYLNSNWGQACRWTNIQNILSHGLIQHNTWKSCPCLAPLSCPSHSSRALTLVSSSHPCSKANTSPEMGWPCCLTLCKSASPFQSHSHSLAHSNISCPNKFFCVCCSPSQRYYSIVWEQLSLLHRFNTVADRQWVFSRFGPLPNQVFLHQTCCWRYNMLFLWGCVQ